MRIGLMVGLLSLASAESMLAQDGYRILFHADSTTIAEADQRAIFDQLGYVAGADGSSLEVVDCGTIFTQVDEEDLNGDGNPEVFVLGGNSCTSGFAGSNLTLFVRNPEGGWGMNLGFPAGGWTVLEAGNEGFPDLSIGGPGFCEAVYRWDGSTYQYHGNRETEPGGCAEVG
jgi:hypothetical protein